MFATSFYVQNLTTYRRGRTQTQGKASLVLYGCVYTLGPNKYGVECLLFRLRQRRKPSLRNPTLRISISHAILLIAQLVANIE
jgi:hypothetical protein